MFFHTPNKTLTYVVHVEPDVGGIRSKDEYLAFYLANKPHVTVSKHVCRDTVKGNPAIMNDYETSMDKVRHAILEI